MSVLLTNIEDRVATLSLNRPDQLNALDQELTEALVDALSKCEDSKKVRAIVIRGEGDAFMAGGDLKWFHESIREVPREDRQGLFSSFIPHFHKAITLIREMGKPVIAAVHGSVAGGGMGLMSACDLAYAAKSAKFMMAYSLIGTSPDGGTTFHVPRAVGIKKAMEMALLSEPMDAETARDIGLVNKVFDDGDLLEEVGKIAGCLAAGPTAAYGRTKALMNESFSNSLEQQLKIEVEAFSKSAVTADFAEGLRAFVDKRDPKFKGE